MKAWNKWMPSTYKLVKVIPNELVLSNFAANGVTSAHSGGLDAAYAALDAACGPYKLRDLKFCPMIHGLDIALSKKTGGVGFNSAFNGTSKVLDPLLCAATNFRQILKPRGLIILHW